MISGGRESESLPEPNIRTESALDPTSVFSLQLETTPSLKEDLERRGSCSSILLPGTDAEAGTGKGVLSRP